ncbi:DEAD/DEAH box helicase [Bosea sp. AS-1]|uniref:DEAD/DEAH box helicase n=1 Tax=Bosea sp. AS-1 TaxID=2015316 RepID=UPI000B775688|nr:DEAD/DEAH box helicase [Bosea sp. AS-1]
MLTLRPYQRDSIDALYAYWQKGGGNGLIVIPTGGGKSLVIATIIREMLEQWPSLRICVVTHSKELISQNFQELMKLWPQAPAGINSAGIGRRDTRSKILFCGIQSVWNKVKQIGAFDLIIVDEAHLISRSADTSYGKFFASMREIVPDMRVLGATATPYRLDSGRLDRGKDRLFDDIVYEAAVPDLIEAGFLSPLTSKATATALDVSGVAKRGGEYVAGALEAAVDKDWITRAAVDEITAFGASRKSWLCFCTGVDHAMHVRDEIRSRGITCETVTGETPNGERDRIIRQFKEGRIRCLTNANVLSIGFNVPAVDLVALLRPTQSAGLYIQQVGRAFRLAPGKTDALILDFAGNVKRHGPVDDVTPKGSGGKGDAPSEDRPKAKECPGCKELVALNTRVCQHCGHEWPRDETPKHDARADADRPIMSTGAVSNWLEVSETRFFRHAKVGSPTSMRVEYTAGLTVYRQWVCFEHDGFARQKAESWWRRMGLGTCPKTVSEALERQSEIMPAAEIQVRPSGQYFEVVGVRALALEAAE